MHKPNSFKYLASVVVRHRERISLEVTRQNISRAVHKFNAQKRYGERIEANGLQALYFIVEDFCKHLRHRKVRHQQTEEGARYWMHLTVTNLQTILKKDYRTCRTWLWRLVGAGFLDARHSQFQFEKAGKYGPVLGPVLNCLEVLLPLHLVHFEYQTIHVPVFQSTVTGDNSPAAGDKRQAADFNAPPMHPKKMEQLRKNGQIGLSVPPTLGNF